MLVQSQEEFVKGIIGQQDAKTTMDNIAAFQQDLLSQAGLIK
jgi:multiple sugar transport system substrate-binding protein